MHFGQYHASSAVLGWPEVGTALLYQKGSQVAGLINMVDKSISKIVSLHIAVLLVPKTAMIVIDLCWESCSQVTPMLRWVGVSMPGHNTMCLEEVCYFRTCLHEQWTTSSRKKAGLYVIQSHPLHACCALWPIPCLFSCAGMTSIKAGQKAGYKVTHCVQCIWPIPGMILVSSIPTRIIDINYHQLPIFWLQYNRHYIACYVSVS